MKPEHFLLWQRVLEWNPISLLLRRWGHDYTSGFHSGLLSCQSVDVGWLFEISWQQFSLWWPFGKSFLFCHFLCLICFSLWLVAPYSDCQFSLLLRFPSRTYEYHRPWGLRRTLRNVRNCFCAIVFFCPTKFFASSDCPDCNCSW